MMTAFKQVIPIMLAILLLAANVGIAAAAMESSMIAQNDVPSPTGTPETYHNVADLLLVKSDKILKPYGKIIAKLIRQDKSLCDQESDARLVAVFRSFEGSNFDDPQTAKALDAIRSLYGIRKAICEAGLSGVDVPASCKKLLAVSSFDMSRKQLISSEITLANSVDITACLRKFQEHHYFWTSYSNNRQDAIGVHQMVRSDIEMYSIIMNLRDFEAAWTDFSEDVIKMHKSTGVWFDAASQKAQNLSDLQDASFSGLEEHVEELQSTLLEHLESTAGVLGEHDANVQSLLSRTDRELSKIAKDAELLAEGMMRMKTAIGDIYTSSALEIVAFTQDLVGDVSATFDLLDKKFLMMTDPVNDVLSSLQMASAQANSNLELQMETIIRTKEQHDLANQAFEKQGSTVELATYLHSLLEQTSTRVEHLSTTTSTITHLISIFKQYEHILLAVCIYIAISVFLAPLDNTIIPRPIVSNVKAVYWAVQAAIFLFRKFGVRNKLNHVQHLMEQSLNMLLERYVVQFFSIMIVVGLAIFWLLFRRARREVAEKADIEKAGVTSLKKPHRLMISDSQRRRLELCPRRARHGTAPPGL